MPETLYLIETRAARDYLCSGCKQLVRRGSRHFRHDPYAPARVYRGLKVTHWCLKCINNSSPSPKDNITKRIRLPITHVRPHTGPVVEEFDDIPLWQPLIANLIGIGTLLSSRLAQFPELLHELTPEQFEEFVCDRLYAMGMEPKRVGSINRKDGGVDVIFWPRLVPSFGFLGAAQIKHHQNPKTKEGSPTIRDLAGVVAGHSFNAGLVITNTTFTPDAQWFAREHAKLIRLRDFTDLKRWVTSNFSDEAEWREIPKTLQLCPGVIIPLR